MKEYSGVLMLGHKARNGKDTLAKAIVDNKDKLGIDEVKLFGFAEALKEELRNIKRIEISIWKNESWYRDDPEIGDRAGKTAFFSIDGNEFSKEEIIYYNVDTLIPMFEKLGHEPKAHRFCRFVEETEAYGIYEFTNYNEDMYRNPFPSMMILAQWWGTEYRRKDNDNYWVDQCYNKIDNWFKCYDHNMPETKRQLAIITDCRFPNEFYHEFDYPTAFVEVERYKEDGSRYLDPNRDKNHPSEIGLDGIKFKNYVLNFEEKCVILAELKLFDKFFNLFRASNFSIKELGKTI